jgi:hypothetical protein
MNVVNGQLEFFQEDVKIKHITLDLIMEYIDRLSSTRRVHRNLEYISEEVRDKFLFDREAYGEEGMFYWRDDLQESYYNFNDRGCMPSLWLPFYIEKEDGRYFLNVQEFPKGNDGDSLKSWLRFLHETLFFPVGVYSIGEFDIENADFDQHHSLIFTKEGMATKEDPDWIDWDSEEIDEYSYPIIFDYISKFIELNGLETFDFDEKNYTWEKRSLHPENSYMNALKFMEDTRKGYGDQIEEDYKGIIYQPELTRILFCEEDIAQIDENYLETDYVGEYHEIITNLIDDLGDPEFLIAMFNARKAIAGENEDLVYYLYQNAFYKKDDDGETMLIDKIDMDILRELGYSVDDTEQLSLELKCSIVSAAIGLMDFKMFMCQKENGISISRDKY